MKPKELLGLILMLGVLAVYAGLIDIPDNIIPTPTPTPPTQLYAVVVEETGDTSPEHRIVLASPTVRGMFEKPEHFRVIDPDTPTTPDIQRFKDRATQIPGNTVLFLVSPDGTIHYEGELPKTIQEFETLYRGIMS